MKSKCIFRLIFRETGALFQRNRSAQADIEAPAAQAQIEQASTPVEDPLNWDVNHPGSRLNPDEAHSCALLPAPKSGRLL